MRALTVQQPWAWAIIHGGKDVENRTQAWGYRGPLAIHAGARWSHRGASIVPDLLGDDLAVLQKYRAAMYGPDQGSISPAGAIIGVVQLAGVHHAEPECCDSPWAEQSYDEHGGRTRRDVVHLILENPRPLPEPVRCRGALGLWTLPDHVAAEVQ